MSYSEVFGGGSINPAQRTYLSLVISQDVQLQWPTEQQIGGDNVAADIIDVEATVAGLNVDFDDARIISTGYNSLITNVGAETVTIRDADGGTILSLDGTTGPSDPGESWFIYLVDNTTNAGTWRTFQLGATVSTAQASALAGAGLKAISTTLNRTVPPTIETVSPVTWTDANRARFTIWGGGVGQLDLPSPGTVGSDWFAYIRNEGTGDLTVVPPSGDIDSQSALVLAPGNSCNIVTDGTDFYTIGLGQSATVGFDFVQIDVSGSGDFVLSGVQLNRISYRFVGTLLGDRKIVVPSTTQQYWVDNSTTGAFDLTVGTAAQVTSIQVIQNNRAILYCDGTDVVDAETSTLTPPITIGQGGTGATNASDARTNLATAFEGILINTLTNSGLRNGGDLTADRDLTLDINNLAVVAPDSADFLAFEDVDAANVTVKATIADILSLANVPDVEDSVAASRLLRGDGSGGWDDAGANILIDSIGRLNTLQTMFCDSSIQFRAGSGNYTQISSFGSQTSFAAVGTIDVASFTHSIVEFDGGVLKMFNRADSEATEAGYGQLWNRSGGVAGDLIWTGDDDVDVPITEQGFLGGDNTKWKTATTTRNTTGVSPDPHLAGWVLEPGYYEVAGALELGVNAGVNGGFDFNFTLVSGTIGFDSVGLLAQADAGTDPTDTDWYNMDIGRVLDTVLTYAVRNDATRAMFQGYIDVTATATIDFEWAPRLAGNGAISEGSWIRFKRIDQ